MGGKKGKKKKEKQDGGEVEKTEKAASLPTDEADARTFNWKKAVKAQLRAADGQLPFKQLRKRVIAACVADGAAGGADKLELRATFAKKLGKTTGVETVGDVVRIAN